MKKGKGLFKKNNANDSSASDKNATDLPIEELVKDKKIPILVLDKRWHNLFVGDKKPSKVVSIEKKLNELLKEQGKLVNEIKELKKAKSKLMSAIVSQMQENSGKKKDKQQKLLIETKEKIEKKSDELMSLPYEIKQLNEMLLIEGINYLYNDYNRRSDELEELTESIEKMREELKEKVAYKVDLEESLSSAYSLMHSLLGHEVMDIFDRKN